MMAASDRPYELPVTLFTSLIFIIIIIIIINNMFIPRTPTPGSRLCFIFCVVGAAKRFIIESAAVNKIIYVHTNIHISTVVTVLYSVHRVDKFPILELTFTVSFFSHIIYAYSFPPFPSSPSVLHEEPQYAGPKYTILVLPK